MTRPSSLPRWLRGSGSVTQRPSRGQRRRPSSRSLQAGDAQKSGGFALATEGFQGFSGERRMSGEKDETYCKPRTWMRAGAGGPQGQHCGGLRREAARGASRQAEPGTPGGGPGPPRHPVGLRDRGQGQGARPGRLPHLPGPSEEGRSGRPPEMETGWHVLGARKLMEISARERQN